VIILMGGCTEDAAHPSSADTAAVLALVFPAFLPALADDPRGTLTRDRNTWRDRREVERFANEVAKRDDELRRLDRAAGDELTRGAGGELDLLLGSQQDDVRERGFDGVAEAPRTLATRRVVGVLQIPLVPWVDIKAAGESTAQGLVRGDQRA
jgi:hypothetical protein